MQVFASYDGEVLLRHERGVLRWNGGLFLPFARQPCTTGVQSSLRRTTLTPWLPMHQRLATWLLPWTGLCLSESVSASL